MWGEGDIQLGIGSRKESIPTLCDIRWLSREDTISAYLGNFGQVHDALGIIKSESTRQSGYDAESYMRSLEQFKFTHTAFVTQYMLAFIQELSVALQARKHPWTNSENNRNQIREKYPQQIVCMVSEMCFNNWC